MAVTGDGLAAIPVEHVERKLIEIWQKLLRTSPIGVDADFFELGGNSLLAIALIADVNRIFGKKISVSGLFRNPTIHQTAQRLREEPIFKSSFFPLVETGTKPPCLPLAPIRDSEILATPLAATNPSFKWISTRFSRNGLSRKSPSS